MTDLGSDVNVNNVAGKSPLDLAMSNGHTRVAQILSQKLQEFDNEKTDVCSDDVSKCGGAHSVSRNTQVNSSWSFKDDDGSTSLHLAVANGHSDTARMLVQELGADVNVRNNIGDTSIHMAADEGHSVAVRVLHELGADVNVENSDGYHPLHLAASSGHADAIRLLVSELAADVGVMNNKGTTPIHMAAEKGHSVAVRVLHGTRL